MDEMIGPGNFLLWRMPDPDNNCAIQAGAEHVQLSVVDGNEAARRLYEGLGFKPFGKLRTILFA